MDLDELRIYQMAMEFAEKVWNVVIGWDWFAKQTIGRQWVEVADSVGANISEGFGRYHFKDSKNFLYYSRGSLSESKTWLTKAYSRNLISQEEYSALSADIKDLGIKLNNYIHTIGKNT